ncbi:MAG: SAF domain-containing protein [Actinomycetota bacterium]|nr:SAF domain-containing protein [Actinomycetota bacterium]MDQ2848060.1 SAF domain-containing protein [Actinomycetota bacterium]MDQ2958819.1 SAF domain-containing protein [Actinomycetota bacterium]
MTAIICLLCAGLSALGVGARPGLGAITSVVVAGRTVGAGELLGTADLRMSKWPVADVPISALRQLDSAIGRRAASALVGGELISSGVLLEPAIAAALASGRVTTTVSLANPNQAAILRTGAVVDLYTGSDDTTLIGGRSTTASIPAIATNVQVLAVLPITSGSNPVTDHQDLLGLIIATDRNTASRLAAHLSSPFLATLTPPP